MTPAHRAAAVISEDGKLSLAGLPFLAGQAVEVIVLAVPTPAALQPTDHPLRGSVLQYDRPFDPVDDDAWDAGR